MKTFNEIKESADFIKSKINDKYDTAIILGSGLSDICNDIDENKSIKISYKDIPHFKVSTAPGHKGEMIFTSISGKNVILLNGRLHYYEGYSFDDTAYPVMVLSALGIKNLIVTNAAGGINESFCEGDFMLICDHIKLCAENPLRGKNISELGPKFFDMCNAYDKDLIKIARKSAKEANISLKEGVYAYMSGPCFETPAEVKALKILGADAVGMSTVSEVIAANHSKLKVMGVSCITNMAAGITGRPITSEEVNITGEKSSESFKKLIKQVLINL